MSALLGKQIEKFSYLFSSSIVKKVLLCVCVNALTIGNQLTKKVAMNLIKEVKTFVVIDN